MDSNLIVNIFLIGLTTSITMFVIATIWFALTIDKDEKSKHS